MPSFPVGEKLLPRGRAIAAETLSGHANGIAIER